MIPLGHILLSLCSKGKKENGEQRFVTKIEVDGETFTKNEERKHLNCGQFLVSLGEK